MLVVANADGDFSVGVVVISVSEDVVGVPNTDGFTVAEANTDSVGLLNIELGVVVVDANTDP